MVYALSLYRSPGRLVLHSFGSFRRRKTIGYTLSFLVEQNCIASGLNQLQTNSSESLHAQTVAVSTLVISSLPY